MGFTGVVGAAAVSADVSATSSGADSAGLSPLSTVVAPGTVFGAPEAGLGTAGLRVTSGGAIGGLSMLSGGIVIGVERKGSR
ncbi:hypothetical protein [Rhodococcus sp. 06-235-1A]|uniref:hypothetical protein n=1 Tax=Rhodococcus sp. 06-235-1A TaxID=2022508 RepID=UPI001179A263|nr:hypothetical protein [Rhodococcus sp. 06-235-1A]